jgi:hypothetical protein
MIEPILIVDLSEYLEDSIFLLYLAIVRDGATALYCLRVLEQMIDRFYSGFR